MQIQEMTYEEFTEQVMESEMAQTSTVSSGGDVTLDTYDQSSAMPVSTPTPSSGGGGSSGGSGGSSGGGGGGY